MADKTIYRMNVDLAGFKKGQWWEKGKEPHIVIAEWARLGGGVFNGQPIILIETGEADIHGSKVVCPKCGHEFDESKKEESVKDNPKASEPEKIVPDKKPVEATKSVQEINQEKMKELFGDSEDDADIESEKIRKCKGFKGDGTPCEFSGNKVRDNGYCFMHQDQYHAPEEGKS